MPNKKQNIISTIKEDIREIMNENHGFEITDYDIFSRVLPEEFEGYKIVQLSDIHNASFGEDNYDLIEAVMEQYPDAIVVTGDLIKRVEDVPEMVELCCKLSDICPIYFCSGNHEFMCNAYEKLITELVVNGIYVIDDEKMTITKGNAKIYIAGLKDPLAYEKNDRRKKFKQAMEDTNTSTKEFSILLSHRPNFFKAYATTNHDLVFTGHAHGGQWRIFNTPIYAPEQGFFPTYTEGLHKSHGTQMIISRGLGWTSCPIRINNYPEMVVVTLHKNYN